MDTGKITPVETINFPGFQKILDFTATGTESSVSVPLNGDVDKEYKILMRDLSTEYNYIRLNGNNTSIYGIQRLYNSSGTVGANRDVFSELLYSATRAGWVAIDLLTPTGFPKTVNYNSCSAVSGTIVTTAFLQGTVFNSTANVTLISFIRSSGFFAAGTRFIIYARRSN